VKGRDLLLVLAEIRQYPLDKGLAGPREGLHSVEYFFSSLLAIRITLDSISQFAVILYDVNMFIKK
jgi:hypothetical protein